jgi:hypothetical protein
VADAFSFGARPEVVASEPSFDAVCCSIEILVGRGIPGINFSATAFRIAVSKN